MRIIQSRRRFLATASLAGAVSLVGAPRSAHSEPPPETTTVRLPRWTSSAYCWAPAYLAGELLRVEGFTDVQYIESQSVWGDIKLLLKTVPAVLLGKGAY